MELKWSFNNRLLTNASFFIQGINKKHAIFSTDDEHKMSKDETLKDAMATYHKTVETERCKIIDVQRPRLWKTALMFYKSARKDELLRKLNVMFEGYEDAVDAGALRLEFFGDLMREVNMNLFEGKEDHRVPIYSWENVYLIKVAGIMVAHSLLHGGPGIPCLATYVYQYIVSGEREHAASFVISEDLPKTPQTETLTKFLNEVCKMVIIDILYTFDCLALLNSFQHL